MRKKKTGRSNAIVFSNALLVLATVILALASHNKSNNNTLLSQNVVDSCPSIIPDYSGSDYIVLNDNIPNFNDYDCLTITGESFSELDRYGRCGTALAMVNRSMMPTEARGAIGMIKPSGWVQARYEGYVDSKPPYLYNRCHLIAYGLTGQNANELISI